MLAFERGSRRLGPFPGLEKFRGCTNSWHTQLTLQSSVRKHVPLYTLKVRYEAPSGKVWEDKEFEGRFAEWFNEDGYLQQAELRRWLARNIDVISKADPQSKEVIDEKAPRETIEIASEPARSSGLEAQGGAKAAKKSKRKA